MNRKKIIVLFLLILAIAVYFLLFQKDKTLKFIPKNADAVVLIDVKNFSRQYIYSFATHPSKWFEEKKKDKNIVSLKNAGLKMPDFVQVFHLKDTDFSNWYSIVDIKDHQKLVSYLKDQKFTEKEKNSFQNENIFLKIEGDYCILGTSNLAFTQISKQILEPNKSNNFDADQFIDGSIGSLSFISGKSIQNFSIKLFDDEIEIKNNSNTEFFSTIISKIESKHQFLNMELDQNNILKTNSFFKNSLGDSAQINNLKVAATIKEMNDTIITYEYDDDFNEIEKKTVQKVVQPNYTITLQSKALEKTWEYFNNKRWINAEDQFTAIPFQPNRILKNKDEIIIESAKSPTSLGKSMNENYIFIKNDPLLLKSFTTFSEKEKKMISAIDYIFYSNRSQDYYIKMKLKKADLPLILRLF